MGVESKRLQARSDLQRSTKTAAAKSPRFVDLHLRKCTELLGPCVKLFDRNAPPPPISGRERATQMFEAPPENCGSTHIPMGVGLRMETSKFHYGTMV